MRSIACLAAGFVMWIAASICASGVAGAQDGRDVPTFSKHVAPILYKHCTSCHRPGEIAPMSLLTYADARPWAKSIRDEVSEGHMPPWHAEARRGTFLNERRLSDGEKSTLLKWASNGAPEGDPADAPPRPEYAEGWALGTPDVVLEMQEDYAVPADGVLQYEYFYIPTNFTDVKWVQAVEVRPGNRSVVHHVLAYYRAVPDLQRTPVIQPRHPMAPPPSPPGRRPVQQLPLGRRLLATYAPGTNPQIMPRGTALRLEPGGVVELQIHYATRGEAATDRTKVGLVFSREEKPREVLASAFTNATLVLPPGKANVAVDTDVTFLQDATVWGLFPHTHVRGKKWRYALELPDGTRQTVLDIPRYDANWQTFYMFKDPLQIPRGAKLVATAWFDNSAGNPANPDPKSEVRWGDQTWEEMHYTGILVSPSQAATPVKR
jgi:hypothetical protein